MSLATPRPVSGRSPGRPRDPAIDQALVEAALSEMSAHGFTGMSIDAIAERTGIGKPAIYRRFADKSALAIAALTRLTASEGPVATGDLIEDLTRQLLLAHGNLESNGSVSLLGALLSERERQPELIGAYRARLFRPRADKILALLGAAQGRGELRKDLDLEATGLLLLGFLAASYIAEAPLDAERVRIAVRTVVETARTGG